VLGLREGHCALAAPRKRLGLVSRFAPSAFPSHSSSLTTQASSATRHRGRFAPKCAKSHKQPRLTSDVAGDKSVSSRHGWQKLSAISRQPDESERGTARTPRAQRVRTMWRFPTFDSDCLAEASPYEASCSRWGMRSHSTPTLAWHSASALRSGAPKGRGAPWVGPPYRVFGARKRSRAPVPYKKPNARRGGDERRSSIASERREPRGQCVPRGTPGTRVFAASPRRRVTVSPRRRVTVSPRHRVAASPCRRVAGSVLVMIVLAAALEERTMLIAFRRDERDEIEDFVPRQLVDEALGHQ